MKKEGVFVCVYIYAKSERKIDVQEKGLICESKAALFVKSPLFLFIYIFYFKKKSSKWNFPRPR